MLDEHIGDCIGFQLTEVNISVTTRSSRIGSSLSHEVVDFAEMASPFRM
jgi:hypothetical protein